MDEIKRESMLSPTIEDLIKNDVGNGLNKVDEYSINKAKNYLHDLEIQLTNRLDKYPEKIDVFDNYDKLYLEDNFEVKKLYSFDFYGLVDC